MTFIRMAGIALVFLLLSGCYALAACHKVDFALAEFRKASQEQNYDFVSVVKPGYENMGTVLYIVARFRETGALHAFVGIFRDNGCYTFGSTDRPQQTAMEGFSLSMEEIFPPREGPR